MFASSPKSDNSEYYKAKQKKYSGKSTYQSQTLSTESLFVNIPVTQEKREEKRTERRVRQMRKENK